MESRSFPIFIHRSSQKGNPRNPTVPLFNFVVYINPEPRLRTIINQRRRPQPLSLYIEPQPKSYFSPSPTPCQTASSPDSLIQSILRILPHRYSQANQVENGPEEYDEDRGFWRGLDHRVIVFGIVGLILLAFGLGAWVTALYTA